MKPTLVMLHGFGGSGLFYYKMYEQLSKEFDLIFLDLPGMGTSSDLVFDTKGEE